MKIATLKSGLCIAVMAGALTFASCGNNNNQSEGAADTETANTEEMDTESPIDTMVNSNNDTIIDTGDARKPSNNPTGAQVP